MSTLIKISELLQKQGKQQKDLTDFLGIHRNVFSDWKSGKSKSYTKYLYQIASFLNTTPEYLRGETDIKQTNTVTGNYNVVGNHNSDVRMNTSPEGLTDQETELVRIYRTLSEINKAKALLYIAELK